MIGARIASILPVAHIARLPEQRQRQRQMGVAGLGFQLVVPKQDFISHSINVEPNPSSACLL